MFFGKLRKIKYGKNNNNSNIFIIILKILKVDRSLKFTFFDEGKYVWKNNFINFFLWEFGYISDFNNVDMYVFKK